ncbi:hypothetical protein NL676_009358 [Syzygium grande]|nr:hypothetical protein NL676_009358 [Syzygium grande]
MEEEDQTRPLHQVSVDDDDIKGANSHQSDGERATNAPQSSSRLPSKNLKKQKESMANIRNALLVVAVLIASTTYQAVLQPPSFITKVDKNSTKGFQGYYASWIAGPLGRDFAYIIFMSGNTFGFLVSVQMIICLTRDLPVRLPLLLSVAAMVQTYYCVTYYLPFTFLEEFGLKNVELLSILPGRCIHWLHKRQHIWTLAVDPDDYLPHQRSPVRLPLLLSVTALVQTYYCFMYYLPFTLRDKAFGLKNVELLSVLPITMSILLLLAQRQLALALDFWLERLSWFNLLGNMYCLRTQFVNDREAGAKHRRGRSNSSASRLLSEEDQSDAEPVTNASP